MTSDCSTCTCSSAAATPGSGRVLLASHVDHTVTALRTLARRRGTPAEVLAPGLLALSGEDVAAFVTAAREELSSVEAAEVRCLVLPASVDGPSCVGGVEGAGPGEDTALLAAALGAPTLAEAGARVDNASLLPLFADEAGSFHAVYQPIVDLADRRTIGHEALLRAVTPEGVSVYPDQLFPAAEAAGWTNLLDRVGRTTALRDAGAWLGDDLLFINFVPTSIYRPEVCLRTTEQAAAVAGVRLDQIVFEVTEGHQVQDLDHLEHVFSYYRSRNCKVALDDLGAGYSSLNTLVRLQPDVVKLDKDIVQELPGRTASAVVEAIVTIAHAYGGLVLAECVETAEQAAAALELGVDLGQGWYFGRPGRPGCERQAVPAVVETVAPPRRAPRSAAPVLPPSAGLPTDLLTRALDGAVGGVSVVDVAHPDMPAVFVNPALTRLTGFSSEELLGRNMRMLQGPATDPAEIAGLSRALREGEAHRSVLRNYRKDGSTWWNELQLSPVLGPDGRATHYLGYQLDVTDRVEAQEALLRQAGHDALTGLANRSALFEGLEASVARAGRTGGSVAVVFLDLDGFKQVNDTFGHATGDAVLTQVGERLDAALRRGDLLARIGGDEFVAVLSDLDPSRAERVAARVADGFVRALEPPLTAGPVEVRLSGSVGVALSPQHALSADRLLAEADAAMYLAKREGVGLVRSAPGDDARPVTDR